MKWYFAANQGAILHAWDLMMVTLDSGLRHTRLEPICLIDPGDSGPEVRSRLDIMARRGVKIIEHKAELYPIVKRTHDVGDKFSGHWLRCDIPIIDRSDDIVLYTDMDVMFVADPEPLFNNPKYLSCAPEADQDNWSYFNSGVMLMNLTNLRATRDRLIKHVEDNIANMAAHDDQGALNSVYRDQWDHLDIRLNWKPYWGLNPEAKIVHFHGPKPGVIYHYMGEEIDPLTWGAELYSLYQRSPQGYAAYIKEYETYPIER